jgi:two-component system, cell cycle response regulator CtrA
MRLLIIEKHASAIAAQVCDDRWSVIHADSADEALSILRHDTCDLVLVDAASLGPDSFSFIRRLRTARDDTPVVALTGPHAHERTSALSLGADDAIAQPFDAAELRARIMAVIRRNKGHSHSLLQAGDLSLSLDSREVHVNGIPVHLTVRETAVLELLMLRKGMVITKDMLLNHLYGGLDEPETKIIDVFVCKVRKRLEQVGLGKAIETVWGHGYIMRSSAMSTPSACATAGDSPSQLDRQSVQIGQPYSTSGMRQKFFDRSAGCWRGCHRYGSALSSVD